MLLQAAGGGIDGVGESGTAVKVPVIPATWEVTMTSAYKSAGMGGRHAETQGDSLVVYGSRQNIEAAA
jgi:hypothetical protein